MKKIIIVMLLGIVACKKKESVEPIPVKEYDKCICYLSESSYNPVTKEWWSRQDTVKLQVDKGVGCATKNYSVKSGPTGGETRICELE